MGDEHAGLPPELAREQELLGVAAGEQPGRRPRRCAVDAVGVDCLRRRCFHGSAAHERRAAVLACRHAGHAVVLVDRELGQQAGAETVGRDGAQLPAAKGGHVPAREIGAVDGDPAAGWAPAARSARRQAPAARCRRRRRSRRISPPRTAKPIPSTPMPPAPRTPKSSTRSRTSPSGRPRRSAASLSSPTIVRAKISASRPAVSAPASTVSPWRITVTRGGVRDAHAERLGDALADGPLGGLPVECHLAREEVVRVQPIERDAGVGDGRLGPAEAVAGRAGPGARALRPHAKRAAGVDPGDAAAAGADRQNLDGRRHDRPSFDRALVDRPRQALGNDAQSLLVPPMSIVATSRRPMRLAMNWAPTPPPAGPDITVRTGSDLGPMALPTWDAKALRGSRRPPPAGHRAGRC